MQHKFQYYEADTAVHEHKVNTSKREKVGQPQYEERTDAFLDVASFLEENDVEQITMI